MKQCKNVINRLYNNNPLRFIDHSVVGFVGIILIILIIAIINRFGLYGYSNNSDFKQGRRMSIVVTNSMEPAIMVNGIIIVEPITIEELDIGDIIRYNSPLGYSVVHRVIAIGNNNEFVITKGDNNDNPDSFKATNKEITGRVIEIHNEYADYISAILGRININNLGLSLLRVLIGFVFLSIILAFSLLGIYYIFQIWSIHYAWYNKQNIMQSSIDWLDQRITKDKFNDLVNEYRDLYNNTHGIKRLILMERFRKLYDVMDTEEKKAKRTLKYHKKYIKYKEKIKLKQE